MLTFDGMAFLPVVTAAVVGARLTGSLRSQERPLSGHVIVAGLGNVGTRIAGQLHDLGVDVVCVDKNEHAAGHPAGPAAGAARGDRRNHREETLRAAGIRTSQALVSVTNSDIVNLETALHARALAADVRLVLRLSDDDLAERVQKTVGNTISRSVPYLAAPGLRRGHAGTPGAAHHPGRAARAADRGRRGGAGSELAGQPVESVHRAGCGAGDRGAAGPRPTGWTGHPPRLPARRRRTGSTCWPPGPG